MAEFQALVVDTERLLQGAVDMAGDQTEEIRGKIHDSLKCARGTLRDTKDSLKGNIRERSQATVDVTEVYVDEHLWQNINIATGVDSLLDLLVSRC